VASKKTTILDGSIHPQKTATSMKKSGEKAEK
jgi:hypothetical protein